MYSSQMQSIVVEDGLWLKVKFKVEKLIRTNCFDF